MNTRLKTQYDNWIKRIANPVTNEPIKDRVAMALRPYRRSNECAVDEEQDRIYIDLDPFGQDEEELEESRKIQSKILNDFRRVGITCNYANMGIEIPLDENGQIIPTK